MPNFFGIGVKKDWPIVETIRGGFHVERHITPGKWTHLAAVYMPPTLLFERLIFDGSKVEEDHVIDSSACGTGGR